MPHPIKYYNHLDINLSFRREIDVFRNAVKNSDKRPTDRGKLELARGIVAENAIYEIYPKFFEGYKRWDAKFGDEGYDLEHQGVTIDVKSMTGIPRIIPADYEFLVPEHIVRGSKAQYFRPCYVQARKLKPGKHLKYDMYNETYLRVIHLSLISPQDMLAIGTFKPKDTEIRPEYKLKKNFISLSLRQLERHGKTLRQLFPNIDVRTTTQDKN